MEITSGWHRLANGLITSLSDGRRVGSRLFVDRRPIHFPREPVAIVPAILRLHPELDADQREVVAHSYGPLLVVAGPGSGKTYASSSGP